MAAAMRLNGDFGVTLAVQVGASAPLGPGSLMATWVTA
jgi:hypothetical protein